METGTKIRLLREKENWGQDVLAEKLGISQPAVSKLESGQIKLSWETAEKLAKIFEVDPEYFFDSKVNNYISNNDKVNQLYNSTYNDNEIDFIKSIYESHLKTKDDWLEERNELILELRKEISDLKAKLSSLEGV